jgi:signal transduction histidine kinase
MAQRGRSWALWVTDDGCGLGSRESSDTNCTGLGLPNMRKRADDIGARIDWSATDGGGTTVTVIFTFDGNARR